MVWSIKHQKAMRNDADATKVMSSNAYRFVIQKTVQNPPKLHFLIMRSEK